MRPWTPELMQAAADQQLTGARYRAGHDQRAGGRGHPRPADHGHQPAHRWGGLEVAHPGLGVGHVERQIARVDRPWLRDAAGRRRGGPGHQWHQDRPGQRPAIAANGAPRPTSWARTPGHRGTEHDPHRRAGHRRSGSPDRPEPSSSSASQAIPVVHTTPKATPNTIRPASSTGSRGTDSGRAGQGEQDAGAQRDPAGAEPVGGQPGGHRHRQRGQPGQGEQQGGLCAGEVIAPGQARQQRDNRRLSQAGDEDSA